MKSVGLDYLAALCSGGSITDLVEAGDIGHLFHTEAEKAALDYVRSHAMSHGALPKPDTVSAHTGAFLIEPKEPASYYLKHLHRRHIETTLRQASKQCEPFMATGPTKDPEAALEIMAKAVFDLSLRHMDAQILDFRNAREAVLSQFIQQQVHGSITGIRTGWQTLDEMMGGCQAGDLISYVARPGMGKTWSLLYSAHYAWEVQHQTPLVVSLEMPAIQIQQRMAALFAHIPSMGLKTGFLTTEEETKLKDHLVALGDADRPFWLVDGQMSVSIEDLLMIAKMLNPSAIYVDGAYMLDHPNKMLNHFAKVSAVATFLKKDLAMGLKVPVFASWQLNRESTKTKKGEIPGLQNIGDSDEIGRLSSVVLGLFEDKTPESIHTRLVHILKGRGGEVGQFRHRWDFMGMNFSEVEEEDLDELTDVG